MGIALPILVIMVAVSLAGLFGSPRIIEQSLFRPYWLLRRRQYQTVVTSGFVHADLAHLLFNAFTFYFFAFQVERQVGSARFAALYLFGLVASDLGTWFKHRDDPNYASLGASGAISAVLFASIVYFPWQKLIIFPIPIPIPAPLFAIGYVAYSWYAARHPHGRINHDAHLGGALAGLVFVLLVDPGAYANLLGTFTR